ncbi:LPS export ABC transporter periplasmic protein LptC [Winogradskyella ursingii]|uniref:LPS export ABC transporter periplasmic protein LptC n=1 Tax=Winogradskyella ursingii TaxID=2686079 RepID=UPI0015C96EC6|nr:LPS export ABC transporter periplasmic protein LptC [Winogradskyella ursingii]
MNFFKIHIFKSIVTAIVVTMFFSCEDNFNKVQKIGILQNQPIGEAEDIDLKYTEYNDTVVKLLANLISPKMYDYSNRDFGFSEFPDGIELKIYDENNNKTTILANYAIFYSDTDVIDLQGNVRVATHEKDTLFTEQLYYNQKLEWVFTNEPFYFKRPTTNLRGTGFDSDKDLKKRQVLETSGVIEVDN